MPDHGLLVVGSGPAGVAAARSFLDAGGRGPVAVLTSDSDPPYQRPPLSKEMLRAASEAPTAEPILAPDGGLDGITVVQEATVSRVDLPAHTLRVAGDTHRWERLVLAPGARPVPLPVAHPDADLHHLRTLGDARRLHEAASHARTAVVIGSGFIGCEAAASLAVRGIRTTLVTPEPAPQQDRLGEHAAAAIRDWLTELGVVLVTGTEVTSVEAPHTVHTDGGRTHRPDLVLVAVGAAPATDFLDGSGVAMHEGRVVVDDRMRTSVPDVWAAGDCARAHHSRAARPLSVEHWGDALAMGEVAGRGAAGDDGARWETPPGFWSRIGERQLKYTAVDEHHDEVAVSERPGGFTVRYGRGGTLVGVLTHEADDDYDRAAELVGRVSFDEAVRRPAPGG